MVGQEAVAAAPVGLRSVSFLALAVLAASSLAGPAFCALHSGVLAEAQHADVHKVALSALLAAALAIVAEADGLGCPACGRSPPLAS